jgi:predicted fused transcriptional regulator/phosphomethylpyrimidine kinase/membrane-bound inhibitor of C-type lysozyme
MVEEAYYLTHNDTTKIKKAIAKSLYNKKVDQPRISQILNLSQPMVSNYCSSQERIPDKIQKDAEVISKKILNGQTINFHTCISFSGKKYEGTYYIAQKNELISQEKSSIVENLTKAFLILKGKNLEKLVPEVKINIAMAKEHPMNSDDVAAFQNGLIIIGNIISSYNGIIFGKSKHLSSLLLSLKKEIDVRSIMNVAYIKEIEKTNFNYDILTKDYKLKNKNRNIDILLHKGDFGIEPCSYILGNDAVDVANKVVKIMEEIK